MSGLLNKDSQTQVKASSVRIAVHGQTVPAFKNRKRSGINSRTGKLMSYTREDIKKRMQVLEDAIVSALYSSCQTTAVETPSECLRRLRTLLSELSDDSVKEVPSGSWDVRYVPNGQEGVEITIEVIA